MWLCLLQLETPLDVSDFHIVSRPPVWVVASVLKTAFLNPGGHDPDNGGTLELGDDRIVSFRLGVGVGAGAATLGAGGAGGAAHGTATGVAMLPAARMRNRHVKDSIFRRRKQTTLNKGQRNVQDVASTLRKGSGSYMRG